MAKFNDLISSSSACALESLRREAQAVRAAESRKAWEAAASRERRLAGLLEEAEEAHASSEEERVRACAALEGLRRAIRPDGELISRARARLAEAVAAEAAARRRLNGLRAIWRKEVQGL